MKVPLSKDQVSLSWLNEVLSPRGINVVSFAWAGSADNGVLGALSTLERLVLKVTHEGSDGTLVTLPIVVKTLPENPGMRKYVIDEGYCMRELKAYTEIFPNWINFLDEKNVSPEHRYKFPVCYYGAEEGSANEWRHILYIEDFIDAGLKMWPSGFASSLSWKEAKSIVKQIALFHAVGIAYRITHGINYASRYPYLNTTCDGKIEFYVQSGFDATIKMLEEEKEQQSVMGDNVDKEFRIQDDLFEVLNGFRTAVPQIVYRMMNFDENSTKMGTLCHMDLHVNNFMFSDDFEHAVFFDFQAIGPAPPMKDLSFFLILNCDTSLISSERAKVLEFYHSTLQAATKAMGVDWGDYTLETMTQEYLEYAHISLLHIITGAPMWCFGKGTSEVTKNRFRNAIILLHKQGLFHKYTDNDVNGN